MELATSTTANIAKQPIPLLAFLASVDTLWQPIVPPALNLPVLAISSSWVMSVPAAQSRTLTVEVAWPAAMSIVSAAPVLPVFRARLNTIQVGLLALPAAQTVILVIPLDASPAPPVISRAMDHASRLPPPNQSAFPALAQQSSAPLAVRPATWTQAAS